MKHFYIIGAGGVATHLASALQRKGYTIDGVYSRTQQSAETLAEHLRCSYTASIASISTSSDVYLFALSDNILASVIEKVATMVTDALFIHTAGSISIDVFPKNIERCGVMYPLQTFSRQREISVADIPFFIEGNTALSTDEISKIASLIGKSATVADSNVRKQLHLAAVFACNFSNHCYTLAAEQLKESNLSFDVLMPLIMETVAKLSTLPPEKAQTGPAMRNDKNVQSSHLDMLAAPLEREIYQLMSRSIYEHSNMKG